MKNLPKTKKKNMKTKSEKKHCWKWKKLHRRSWQHKKVRWTSWVRSQAAAPKRGRLGINQGWERLTLWQRSLGRKSGGKNRGARAFAHADWGKRKKASSFSWRQQPHLVRRMILFYQDSQYKNATNALLLLLFLYLFEFLVYFDIVLFCCVPCFLFYLACIPVQIYLKKEKEFCDTFVLYPVFIQYFMWHISTWKWQLHWTAKSRA